MFRQKATKNRIMLTKWSLINLILSYFILSIHGQAQDATGNHDVPSIPVHNDTSHDNDGADHDSEPFRNNGRGSHEAHLQNLAAETDAIHGQPIETFQKDMLNQHNLYRRQMCAKDLQMDEDLHQIAQRLANDKANEKPSSTSNDYNELLQVIDTGDPSTITPETIVKTWFDENKQYNSQNEASAMHYSQLVWKSSTKLGIGHAYSSHKLYIVALFKPPGNIRGQFAANVGCASN